VAKQRQPFNPFYAALVIVGVAFTITACGYAVMMVRAARPSDSTAASNGGLMALLEKRGMEIMGLEVLLLAVATVGAIGLDQWRSRDTFRAAERPAARSHAERGNEEGT
jgi:hypothetical protein